MKMLQITVNLHLDDDADVDELVGEFNKNEVEYSFDHDYIVGSYIPVIDPSWWKEGEEK